MLRTELSPCYSKIRYIKLNSTSCVSHNKCLHITNTAHTSEQKSDYETAAQSLQPHAALFKTLIEVGTNEFLKQLSLLWEDMGWVGQLPLSLPENRLFKNSLAKKNFKIT